MTNLESTTRINKAISSGDMRGIDQIIAENAVDHAGMEGDINGREAIIAELTKIHNFLPDHRMEVIKEFADKDYTMQWVRITGTASTEDFGMPVGSKVDMTAIEIVKYKYGKAIEHWEYMQPADMKKMMPESR